MKQIAEKLQPMERHISKEMGELSLFALFLREDAPDKWDLLVAAPWVEKDKQASLEYLAKLLPSYLEPEELLSISRIALIDEANPALEAIRKAIAVIHGLAEISDSNFFGLQIKHAYIITSKKLQSA